MSSLIIFEKPIIKSLTDVDFYKFTMQQVAFLKYPNIKVRFAFKNRTDSVPLAKIIDQNTLRAELEHVRRLSFVPDEIAFLSSQRRGTGFSLFNLEFLRFLKELKLPDFYLEYRGDNIILEFYGNWPEVTLWETLSLSIINELYYRSTLNKEDLSAIIKEGDNRLYAKLDKLYEYPDITFTDFGTRRRFSRWWHKRVIETLKSRAGFNLTGTSNVGIAKNYKLKPIGTMAHEMDMVMSGIMHGSDEEIRASHQQVLNDWQEVYGDDLSIALTDTYGSDFFFRDMTHEQAHNWIGLRHDSGDPIAFGEKAINFYKDLGINPLSKILVFSDGLDADEIIRIYNHFNGRIGKAFGWGTNLTNDLGPKPLSLVVKAVESNGFHTVKLSDNLAKATGPEKEIQRFKKIFGHNSNWSEPTIY